LNFIFQNLILYFFILEEVFPDVVRGLKEDMDVELENLQDQYEEQRREGVEKIKAKYNKRN
jgi:hypothetical protein